MAGPNRKSRRAAERASSKATSKANSPANPQASPKQPNPEKPSAPSSSKPSTSDGSAPPAPRELMAEPHRALRNEDMVQRDRLRFKMNDVVIVTEKREDGWWWCRRGIASGWVLAKDLSPEPVGTAADRQATMTKASSSLKPLLELETDLSPPSSEAASPEQSRGPSPEPPSPSPSPFHSSPIQAPAFGSTPRSPSLSKPENLDALLDEIILDSAKPSTSPATSHTSSATAPAFPVSGIFGPLKETQKKFYEMAWIAFHPGIPDAEKRISELQFYKEVENTASMTLLPVLASLVRPDAASPWLAPPLMKVLARVALRPKGVQAVVEFVLYIHPSNAGAAPTGSRGSGITSEALKDAASLIALPPPPMTADEWFSAIAPQLFDLLDGNGEPDMDKVAAYIIGSPILGKREFGHPEKAGWKQFVVPIYKRLAPPHAAVDVAFGAPPDFVGDTAVLVSSDEIRTALRRLVTLTTSHPNPMLTRRLLLPLVFHLWSIASWSEIQPSPDVCGTARMLLITFFQLSQTSHEPGKLAENISEKVPLARTNPLLFLADHLLERSTSSEQAYCFAYSSTADKKGMQIVWQHVPLDIKISEFPRRATIAVTQFVLLMQDTPHIEHLISELFLYLCHRCLLSESRCVAEEPILLRPRLYSDSEQMRIDADMQSRALENMLILGMLKELPTKLVSDLDGMLQLVLEVLQAFNSATCDEEREAYSDALAPALSLLLQFVSTTEMPEEDDRFVKIQEHLVPISAMGLEVSEMASTLLSIMGYETWEKTASAKQGSRTKTDDLVHDRKSWQFAQELMTDESTPAPVVAQGLDIIIGLIAVRSPIVDIPLLHILCRTLLESPDDYICDHTINCLVHLAQQHPNTVFRNLLEDFSDEQENYGLDHRMRMGQAISKVIPAARGALSGDTAKHLFEGLLAVAGRRLHRPRTEERRQKEAVLMQAKGKEAKEAWEGDVPQLFTDDELNHPHEADKMYAEQELLEMKNIINGWESQRGEEDIRIRTSACVNVGLVIEQNLAGIGPELASLACSLCVTTLILETEPAAGMLRRAVLRILNCFILATDKARQQDSRSYCVPQNMVQVEVVLAWVREFDNDGLTRQYAQETLNNLEVLTEIVLTPSQEIRTELTELEGLSINPGKAASRRPRPTIEEVDE